jgi:hypothetical protein
MSGNLTRRLVFGILHSFQLAIDDLTTPYAFYVLYSAVNSKIMKGIHRLYWRGEIRSADVVTGLPFQDPFSV